MLTSLEPFISAQEEVNVQKGKKKNKKERKTGQLLCCIKHAIPIIISQILQKDTFNISHKN